MRTLLEPERPLLPPPVKIILLYAADGLSVWKDRYNKVGRPRTPSRSHWVLMFRQLVETYEGLRILQKLAETGMKAWGCKPDAFCCARCAFKDVTFRSHIIGALEDFAETAQEQHKIHLPKPAPTPYPEEPEETPRPEPKVAPLAPKTAPQKPRFRPKHSGPSLG